MTCIDGRVQRPVVEYLRTRHGFDYVDLITEPGPEAALTAPERELTQAAIRRNIRFSLSAHSGELVAIAAHDGCAGNGAPVAARLEQLRAAAELIRSWEPATPVVGVWVGGNGTVREMLTLGRVPALPHPQ